MLFNNFIPKKKQPLPSIILLKIDFIFELVYFFKKNNNNSGNRARGYLVVVFFKNFVYFKNF